MRLEKVDEGIIGIMQPDGDIIEIPVTSTVEEAIKLRDTIVDCVNQHDALRRLVASAPDFEQICKFLEKEGYLDADWYAEHPTALERWNEIHIKAPQACCMTCNPELVSRLMFLCPQCGNKRCPKATDHRNACTNSNEPGQPGSWYEGQQPLDVHVAREKPHG